MRAAEEIMRRARQLERGDLPAAEPLFTLRARDRLAAHTVKMWAAMAQINGVAPAKVKEAWDLAEQMERWPEKQLPGSGSIPPAAPLPALLKDMTEPQLSEHLNRMLRYIAACETPDTMASLLVVIEEDQVVQYGATRRLAELPQALRELADRLESRTTVERGGSPVYDD